VDLRVQDSSGWQNQTMMQPCLASWLDDFRACTTTVAELTKTLLGQGLFEFFSVMVVTT
jgi:hypothetical protein